MLNEILSATEVAMVTIFSWPNIGYLFIGILLGIVFGAIPGLGGVVAIALVIPFTFWIDSTSAVVLFGAIIGGVAFGGSISAILMNIPGTAPNAASCFDGYPMTKEGRANEALGIAATASALGAIFGLFVLVLLLPFARGIVLLFGEPEFFWLAVLGLTTIAVASQGNVLKGLAAGGFGLMLSLIGYSQIGGVYRYGFGTEYLWDGVQLIPALIGLFAIAEAINLLAKGGTIAAEESHSRDDRVRDGVKRVLKRKGLFLRSSVIGTVVGMIPGAGGTTATFISYIQAAQTSKEPERFGKGKPEGLLACEAANDAKDGGALIPTLVFGIPGSAVMVVLLGGLILHGYDPGRSLINENLDVLFVLIVSLLISNIVTSILGLAFARRLSKVTVVPVKILVPAILVISMFGAYAIRTNVGDIVMTFIIGLFGFAMIVYDYNRIALVLGLILGPIAERALLQSLMISGGDYSIMFTRPISLILIVFTVLAFLLPFLRTYWRRTKRGPT